MAYPSLLITELAVIGLADPGVPNQERILFRPMESVNLAGLGVAVGIPGPDGGAYALYDNVFWFPNDVVAPPSWVVLFTGRGSNTQTTLPTREKAHLYYWQRLQTMFGAPNLVPILFRSGLIVIAPRIPG